MDKPKKDGSGWKWAAGGLALLASYNLGLSDGAEKARVSALASSTPERSLTRPVEAYAEAKAGPDQSRVAIPVPAAEPLVGTEVTAAQNDSGSAAAPDDQDGVPAVGEAAPAGTAPQADRQLASLVKEPSEPTPSAAEDDETDQAPSPVQLVASEPDARAAYEGIVSSSASGAVEAPPTASYFGQLSPETGRPKTVAVRGYFRRDGAYVQPHYRSRPRR